MLIGSLITGPKHQPRPLPNEAVNEQGHTGETILVYCSVCRDLVEVVKDERYQQPRCPLCGFRHGEV